MKAFISIIIFLTLLPLTALADKPSLDFELIPKPQWEVCGDQACMSFEDTQHLARMRAQYVTLHELVPRLSLEAQTWQSMSQTALRSAEHCHDAYDGLFTVYTETSTLLQEETQARIYAEKYAVFGGAMPWVITGLAAALVGGVYLGARL